METVYNIKSILDTIDLIERISYNTIILWDYTTMRILNSSSNLTKMLNYDVINDSYESRNDFFFIPENDLNEVRAFLSKGIESLINHKEDIFSYVFLYHTHLMENEFQSLVFQKTIPLRIENQNSTSPRIFLTSFSFGSNFENQEPLMVNRMAERCFRYNYNTRTWWTSVLPNLKMIEREILSLSTQGLTVREIAAFVNRSEDTVKTYKRAVFEKLGVDNISQAVSMAQNFNLI